MEKKSKFLVLVVIFFITIMGYSQQGINYKALISDDGSALSGQSVTLRFTILEEGTNTVYQETHAITTDASGIVSVQVGEGSVVSGDFSTIDWSKTQFLQVEIDTGDGYEDFGTTALQYVPYAKYADRAGNAFSGKYADLQGKPDYALWDTVAADDFSGDYNDLSNAPSVFTHEGTSTPATQSAENIQHTGSLFIGDSISPEGAGASALRINRKTEDYHASYGLVSVLDGGGSGPHYGSSHLLTGSGAGQQIGSKNLLLNSGNGIHIASYNVINNKGNGTHYGSYNVLDGDGTGIQYGSYNKVRGGGTGAKYGSFNYISNLAGGTHYAVYGNALKAGSYAGYFVGDAYVSKKLKSYRSGDADMKAYIYGAISMNGSVLSSASSSGFTAKKINTGTYRITFFDSSIPYSSYIILTSLQGGGPGESIMTYRHPGYFDVLTFNGDDEAEDEFFFFVVYKK